MKIKIANQKPIQIGTPNPLYVDINEFLEWLEYTFGDEFETMQVRREIYNYAYKKTNNRIVALHASCGLDMLYKWGYLKIIGKTGGNRRIYKIVKRTTKESKR